METTKKNLTPDQQIDILENASSEELCGYIQNPVSEERK